MAAIKGLVVPITATFDGKGTKLAESAIGNLEGQARKLAKTFTGLFAAEKIISFGKAAVDAFAADQKAAAEFGQTLSNLGLSASIGQLTEFIAKLSETYGITKEQLTPAFNNLARYTKDAAYSQELLKTALDISAGSGKDLMTVTTALGAAAGGSNTALTRLRLGLTEGQIKTNTFAQNLKILQQMFKGDAAAAANTFQGTLDRLKNTAHDASVEVGGSLVNAFITLANTGNNGSFSWIKTLGDDLSTAVYWITKFTISVKDILNPVRWLSGPNAMQKQLAKDQANLAVQFNKGLVPYKEGLGLTRQDAISKASLLKTASQNLAIQKQITAQSNAQLAAAKAKSVLDVAGKAVDVQQVEIQAALSQSNDYNINQRLQLQAALLNNNADAAGALAQQILAANAAALQSMQIDPYGNWISGASDALAQVKALQAALAQNGASTFAITPALQASTASALDAANLDAANVLSGADAINADIQSSIDALNSVINQNAALQGSINLNVSATPGLVVNATQAATANGTALNINRLSYNFNN